MNTITEVRPVFDVTDGPTGIKYINYWRFIDSYSQTGKSCDFYYMNFENKPEIVSSVIDALKEFANENGHQYVTFHNSFYMKANDVFVHCGIGMDDDHSVYQVELCGFKDSFNKFKELLSDLVFKKPSEASVRWYFTTGNGIDNRNIYFDEGVLEAKDEHYPFIEGGVHEYLDGFLKSDANVLIMLGVPGTGKTSLVRDFIYRNKLRTYITFDEGVLREDGFFVEFMTNNKADLLVVEDADNLITAREHEINKLMSKFLNVSDGLIKHQNKKQIFTTNVTNIDKIDPALVRAGRCYGVLEFRHLTREEANVIRAKNGAELLTDKSEYTLSEVFNTLKSNIEKRKFGFATQ